MVLDIKCCPPNESYFEDGCSLKNNRVSKEAVVYSYCGIILSSKNKLLIQANAWMNHKEIMLNEKTNLKSVHNT